MKLYYFLTIQLILVQPTFAGEPSWAKDMPRNDAEKLVISCHGSGPDKYLAFRQAMDQCRSIAAEQVSGHFKTQTISMETEESTGFHQEITSEDSFSGLTCNVKKNYEEETADGYQVYLMCQFDTSKIKAGPAARMIFERKDLISSSNRHLIVSTVPQCQSLIVRGSINRMVKCSSNPQTIKVSPEDTELVVRASGFKPKHVPIEESNTMEVYLESN